MSDDLNKSDIENALFALILFKQALLKDNQTCCPNQPESQLYHVLRSILFSCATLKEELLLRLIHALFSNAGAEFCIKGVCGIPDCTFGAVDWEDYTQHGDCPLVKDLANLLEARKDSTFLPTLAAELAHGHRRAVANIIALLKPDHWCAKAMQGSSWWVQALQDGHRRYRTVDTHAECATSVTASRFKDFNDLCDSTVDLEKVTQQQQHIVQSPMYVPTEEAETDEPARKKKKGGAVDLFSLRPEALLEAVRTASFGVSPWATAEPGQLFFSPSIQPVSVKPLKDFSLNYFKTVPLVEYVPGVCGPESICGGGVRGMRATIEAAKQGSSFGDLYLGHGGHIKGWERLPTLLQALRVHASACGTRPYNAWAGPLATEKAIEFDLPIVDAAGELTVTAHESATHAHAFLTHLAHLSKPRMLVTFAHAPGAAADLTEVQLDVFRDTARELGSSTHRALVDFRRVDAEQRRELVGEAFALMADNPGMDAYRLALQAREACTLETKNVRSQAALAARLALLVDPDIGKSWVEHSDALQEFRQRLGTESAAAFLSRATPARRATMILHGWWFDVDAAGDAWPTQGVPRAAGPFAPAEDSDIGTLALRFPPGDTVNVGFLRVPARTATSFTLVLEGHTSVSLTEGHILVLEEAARYVLGEPSVCVAPASVAAWLAELPAPTAQVLHGTVVLNDLEERSHTPTRLWMGRMQLRCADKVHDLTYRSILIQSAAERKRTAQGAAVHLGDHLFPDAYGLDYTPRGTLAALKVDQEVVVTAYAGEAVHAILVGGPALGPSPHRRAIVPLYELTTDAAAPRVDGLNALLSLFAWVAQCLGKAGVAALLSGLQGTGKSLVLKVLSIIFGPNMMRSVKKAEQELEKQFGQEFTNTTFAACDEVGDKFFRAVDGASLKEIITGEINTHEVKQKQGMVKTPNNTSFLFLTNESVPTEKLKRRWITVVCANGLRIVGVGGQAALRYFEAFDVALRSPYRNAGILHLLTHYPLVSNLEVYSADKAKTSAALVETPKEFHLRFLVDLCEFPVRAVSDTTDPFWTVVDAEHEGWGEEEVVAKKHLKQLLTDWHAHVCSRRENANDRLANPATSMLKKLEALFAGNATLAEMNAGQPPESFRLSRTHLRRFLREHGYNVRLPPGLPFYEGHETRRAGL